MCVYLLVCACVLVCVCVWWGGVIFVYLLLWNNKISIKIYINKNILSGYPSV